MKKVIYLLWLATFLPGLLMATDGNSPLHDGPNTTIKKYIKETVMPVLIKKRQEFDLELSTSEKNEIAECKAALKQLQSQRHDWKVNGDNRPVNDFNKDEHKPNPEFDQHRAIIERLQAIAEKHSNSLQDIKTQLEPVRKQWLDDIKKLQPALNNSKSDDNYSGRVHLEHNPAAFLFTHHLSAAHFLLLPVNLSDEDNLQGELKSDAIENSPIAPGATNLAGFTTFEVMPNPASNDVQLGNDILPATNELKIFDLQGKELLNLENVQAGQHLDVSQFANGTYLVQIKSGDQLVSKKLVISK